MLTGVKQSDNLCPLLFMIVMGMSIIATRERTRTVQTIIRYRNLQTVKVAALMNVNIPLETVSSYEYLRFVSHKVQGTKLVWLYILHGTK